MSLESNGVDRVLSLPKIPTHFRGTNICTSLARFALRVVTHPNCPKCTQIVQNTPKHEVRVQWGGSGAFVSKNSDTTSWHKHLHHFGPFCTEFCKATKQSKMHQIVQNTPKYEFRIQWGGSSAFVAKNYDAISWHEHLHQFGPFCTEFRKATKQSRMHPNSTKRTKTSV